MNLDTSDDPQAIARRTRHARKHPTSIFHSDHRIFIRWGRARLTLTLEAGAAGPARVFAAFAPVTAKARNVDELVALSTAFGLTWGLVLLVDRRGRADLASQIEEFRIGILRSPGED